MSEVCDASDMTEHHIPSTTSAPLAESPCHPSKQLPEFLRLPRPGSRCPLTGLSRATLNALVLGDKPKVRSVCLRQRGAARGIRLIVTSSLLSFLYDHIELQPEGCE